MMNSLMVKHVIANLKILVQIRFHPKKFANSLVVKHNTVNITIIGSNPIWREKKTIGRSKKTKKYI